MTLFNNDRAFQAFVCAIEMARFLLIDRSTVLKSRRGNKQDALRNCMALRRSCFDHRDLVCTWTFALGTQIFDLESTEVRAYGGAKTDSG